MNNVVSKHFANGLITIKSDHTGFFSISPAPEAPSRLELIQKRLEVIRLAKEAGVKVIYKNGTKARAERVNDVRVQDFIREQHDLHAAAAAMFPDGTVLDPYNCPITRGKVRALVVSYNSLYEYSTVTRSHSIIYSQYKEARELARVFDDFISWLESGDAKAGSSLYL